MDAPAIYINLDSRTDRRNLIEEELNTLGLKYTRLSATFDPIGIIGCGHSHIRALEQALTMGAEKVWIFEDDYKLLDKNLFVQAVQNLPDCDVFMGSYSKRGLRLKPIKDTMYSKIIEAQTASCYLIKNTYIPVLLENLKEGLELLKKTGNRNYSNDICWKKLQPKGNWITTNSRCGKQRPSYSDIEKKNVDYDC